MNIILDIKPNFESQVVGVIRSLNQQFFNSITIENSSEFLDNKQYLKDTLAKIDSGSTAMIHEDDFWTSIDQDLHI